MSVLLLFDIDGTLLRAPAARKAYQAVFRERFGSDVVLNGYDFSGQTDRIAFRELVERAGATAAEVDAVLERYLDRLELELQHEPGYCLPGVRALLRACAREPDFFLALGTGNLERGARAKLRALGLDAFFPVGGFADDAEQRPDILAAALRKARRYYARRFRRVIVIGDTPRDIAAARAIGARVLAVATGRPTLADLRRGRPDALLPDLSDRRRALNVLRRLAFDAEGSPYRHRFGSLKGMPWWQSGQASGR
ncbi:MAG TPA: HAD family hydrolase [Bacillota bacterium]